MAAVKSCRSYSPVARKVLLQVSCLSLLLVLVLLQLTHCVTAVHHDNNAQVTETAAANKQQVTNARSSFKLSLADFKQFTKLFRKSYESLMEELRRKKLFMARAMRAFVSAAGYKFGNRSSYLSVNAMSDWTREEFDQTTIAAERYQSDLSNAAAQQLKWSELISETAREEDAQFEDATDDELLEEEEEDDDRNLVKPDELKANENLISQAPQYVKMVGGLMANAFSGYKHEEKSNKFARDQVFVDHSKSDCMLSPRGQGRCGSCYAFAAIALYEWYYCNATGVPTAFSEQFITDCGHWVPFIYGCDGGVVYQVSEQVNKFGLELQRNYPYLQKRSECPYSESTRFKTGGHSESGQVRVKDEGFSFVPVKDFAKNLEKSPLIIMLETGDNFQEYGGGVDKPDNCGKHGKHSTLLVGHGREDAQEYWLIRNSYGLDWGQWGYYKLSKKHHHCIQPGVGARLDKFKVLEGENERQVSQQLIDRFV